MPVLTVSENTSPGLGFSRNRCTRPSSSVITTPYSSGFPTRVSTNVAAAPRAVEVHRGAQLEVGERVPGDDEEGVVQAIHQPPHAARRPERDVLHHVFQRKTELRPVLEVALHLIREVVQGGKRRASRLARARDSRCGA